MANPVIVILGAGPGVGAAVGRRFGQAGFDPALISRSEDQVAELGRQLQAEGFTTGWTAVDLTDAAALTAAIQRFGAHSGAIQHLHFNPSVTRMKNVLTLTVDELLDDVRIAIASLVTAVQAARPFMSRGARITATGSQAADRPWADATTLGVQKAGLRNLVQAIDITLAPDGIRAMSLTVNGTLAPDSPFDPRFVADALFDASQTEDEFWSSEVRFDGVRD
jgi:NAD(P)-dependent dehydrogenase (short-subunit alcohol dehydrogenase family)